MSREINNSKVTKTNCTTGKIKKLEEKYTLSESFCVNAMESCAKPPVAEEVPDTRTPEEIEADEIERVFGPVDKKQEDVEQVTGLSEVYMLWQFFTLFLLAFVLGFALLHLSVLFRPTWLPYSIHKLIVGGPLSDDSVLLLQFNGDKYLVSVL